MFKEGQSDVGFIADSRINANVIPTKEVLKKGKNNSYATVKVVGY